MTAGREYSHSDLKYCGHPAPENCKAGIKHAVLPRVPDISCQPAQAGGWILDPALVLFHGEETAPAHGAQQRWQNLPCHQGFCCGSSGSSLPCSTVSISQTEVIPSNRGQKCNLLSDELSQIASHLERECAGKGQKFSKGYTSSMAGNKLSCNKCKN